MRINSLTDQGLRDITIIHNEATNLKALLRWASDHLFTKSTSNRREAVLPLSKTQSFGKTPLLLHGARCRVDWETVRLMPAPC